MINKTIFILDTGLPIHRDIRININKSINFFDNKYNKLFKNHKYYIDNKETYFEDEDIYDYNDHQTNVVGIIKSDKIGVSNKAEIIVGKILNKDGNGTLLQILEAFKYANTMNPSIINISTGYEYKSLSQEEIKIHNLIHQEVKKLFVKNIIIVCASGNNNNDMYFPAKFEETISVSIYYNEFKDSDYCCQIEYFVVPSKSSDYIIKKGSSLACSFLSGIIFNYIEKLNKYDILSIRKFIKDNDLDSKYENYLI